MTRFASPGRRIAGLPIQIHDGQSQQGRQDAHARRPPASRCERRRRRRCNPSAAPKERQRPHPQVAQRAADDLAALADFAHRHDQRRRGPVAPRNVGGHRDVPDRRERLRRHAPLEHQQGPAPYVAPPDRALRRRLRHVQRLRLLLHRPRPSRGPDVRLAPVGRRPAPSQGARPAARPADLRADRGRRRVRALGRVAQDAHDLETEPALGVDVPLRAAALLYARQRL